MSIAEYTEERVPGGVRVNVRIDTTQFCLAVDRAIAALIAAAQPKRDPIWWHQKPRNPMVIQPPRGSDLAFASRSSLMAQRKRPVPPRPDGEA